MSFIHLSDRGLALDDAIQAIGCALSRCGQLHSFTLSCEPFPNLDVVACVLSNLPATVCHVSLRLPWDKLTLSLWTGFIDTCRRLAQRKLSSFALHDTSQRQVSQIAARHASQKIAPDVLRQLTVLNVLFIDEEPSCSRLGCVGY